MRLTALPAFEDNYIWVLARDDGRAVIVDPGDATPVLAAEAQGLRPDAETRGDVLPALNTLFHRVLDEIGD